MLNQKDKLFYENLSRGTIDIFSRNSGWTGIIMNTPAFAIGLFAIGLRMIVRKRQGFLEPLDLLKLFIHLGVLGVITFPNFFALEELLGGSNFFVLPYLILIVLALFYHLVEDFRYPEVGLELRKEYRGRSIFSKASIDEHRDMKVRLYDPLITIIIGFSLLVNENTNLVGWIILACSICLLIEELGYNYHIASIKRTWAATQAFADFMSDDIANNGKPRGNSSDSSYFEPEIPE